jgi:hypothetical protein
VRREHFESKVPLGIAWITYPIAVRHCKKIQKLRSGGQAVSPCQAAGRLHPGVPTGEHQTTIYNGGLALELLSDPSFRESLLRIWLRFATNADFGMVQEEGTVQPTRTVPSS